MTYDESFCSLWHVDFDMNRSNEFSRRLIIYFDERRSVQAAWSKGYKRHGNSLLFCFGNLLSTLDRSKYILCCHGKSRSGYGSNNLNALPKHTTSSLTPVKPFSVITSVPTLYRRHPRKQMHAYASW